MSKPATTITAGLARPIVAISSPGTPKIPAPIMQLMISAVRLQRPIERLNISDGTGALHRLPASLQAIAALAPAGFAQQSEGGFYARWVKWFLAARLHEPPQRVQRNQRDLACSKCLST